MIQIFRVLINSLVGRLFFGILVLTFALLGVGYGFRDLVLRGLQSNDAATVGGATISLQDVDRDYRQDLSNLQRQAGGRFTPDAIQKQQIAQQALDRDVSDALYADAAKDQGIRISDEQIRRQIEAEPAFAGSDKKFDRVRFQMQLEGRGLNEQRFIADLRRAMGHHMLIAPLAGTALAPKALAEDVYRYRNEQRAAQTVFLPDAAVAGVPQPTDADIDAYYKKHAVDFTLPEFRTFTVLSLTPELLMGETTPSDDDVRAAYEARKSEYVVPEQRKIEQTVVPDKAVADAVAKATADGKTTLAAATQAATAGKVQPVLLDFTREDQFPEALRQPVFAAQKGAIVGPVETPLGWHVVRVVDVLPGHAVPLEDAKPKIVEQLKRDAATDKLSEEIDKFGDKLQGGAPMEQVAAGVNATPVKIGPVDAKGNPPPGTLPAADKPAPDPTWIAAAFQAGSGETTSFQDEKGGGYFAVRVDSVTAPALRPLADVRADVVAGWTAEQRAKLNAKLAEDLAAKARAGTPMTDIAAQAKSKMDTTPPVTRMSATLQQGEIGPSPALIDALFQMNKIGDVTTVQAPDGQVVARLIEVHAADPHVPGTELAPVTQELDRALQQDQLAEYSAMLRDRYTVKINPKAVETVVGQ